MLAFEETDSPSKITEEVAFITLQVYKYSPVRIGFIDFCVYNIAKFLGQYDVPMVIKTISHHILMKLVFS